MQKIDLGEANGLSGRPGAGRRAFRRAAAMLLTCAALMTLSARAQDLTCTQETEPNDTPAEATYLAEPWCFEGSLAGSDQDAFTWEVTDQMAAAPWSLSLEGVPGALTKVDIIKVEYADDGQSVVAAERLWDHSASSGQPATSEPFWVAPGRYTLGVSKSGGEVTFRGHLRQVAIAPLEEFPTTEVTREASFSLRGDQANGRHAVTWQLGSGDAGQGWTIEVAAALGERLGVVLRSSGGVLKDETTDPGGTVHWTDLDLLEGSYALEVTALGSRRAPFLIRASRTATSGNTEREPNDDWASASPLPTDAPLTGRLTAGDNDLFTFEVGELLAGQLFDLVVDTAVTVEVALLNSDGAVLQQRRGAGGALRSLHLEAGTYGFSIKGAEGPYELSFRPAGSPQSGVELEPNDTAASAQALDETLTMRGHLTLDDVDVFSFVVPEPGGLYRVQALGQSEGLEQLTIATAGGRLIESTAGEGRRARIDEVELAPGTHLVTVKGRDNEYALRLLDLGTVVEPPPVLEARTDDAGGSPLTVTTVEVPPPAAPDAPEAGQPSAPEALSGSPATPAGPVAAVPARVDPCGPPAPSDGTSLVTISYADDERLACGSHLNTIVDAGVVTLDPEAAAFRFIWVGASHRGTVIKIDTDTGDVLGEYWTAPVFDPERPSQDPSRTVVDRNGNVWVGNRDDQADRMGSVVKIGLQENGQCEDRNGNGVIDTSAGLGDVLAWDNRGDADRLGGVSTAADECILQYIRVNSRGVRHVSVDGDGNVWVTGTTDRRLVLIDGSTGDILRSEAAPCGGYGGLVDRAGVLWSARPLLRWDPNEPLTRDACLPGDSYGIGLDYDDQVWISDFVSGVCRYSRQGEVEVCFDAGADVRASRGVAVTRDNHVWLVHSSGNAVTRFAPDGTIVERVKVGSNPTGVSIDARGKPWVVSNTGAQRIDPQANAVELTVDLDGKYVRGSEDLPFYGQALPYGYSDMTGQLVFGPPDSGTYVIRVRGPSFRTSWRAIRYQAQVPDGAGIEVRVSTSDGLAAAGGLTSVASGDSLELEGQYLYVEVTLRRSESGASPSFSGLELDALPVPLAPGAIRVEARPDLVASSNAIEVILDASGSMGQLLPTGESRWTAARTTLLELARSAFPVGVPVALRVYGHLEPSTCHMALELDLEPFDPESFASAVAGIAPKLLSQTPLADAIAAAGEGLAKVEGQRMIILVTDGKESCGGDPEAAIRSLRDDGVATVNIIGFALQDEEVKQQFTMWAEIGGGIYLDTATAAELGAALNQVLQPEFRVLEPDGREVARGRVNSESVAVPSGLYRVEVLSNPRRVVEGVEVVERTVALTVSLQE